MWGYAGLHAPAAPVCVSETQDQRVFCGTVRFEGLAESAEHFLILVFVFVG
jgi:hypothetical protein